MKRCREGVVSLEGRESEYTHVQLRHGSARGVFHRHQLRCVSVCAAGIFCAAALKGVDERDELAVLAPTPPEFVDHKWFALRCRSTLIGAARSRDAYICSGTQRYKTGWDASFLFFHHRFSRRLILQMNCHGSR